MLGCPVGVARTLVTSPRQVPNNPDPSCPIITETPILPQPGLSWKLANTSFWRSAWPKDPHGDENGEETEDVQYQHYALD